MRQEVSPANLGISSIFLPCKALREYFYRIPEREGSTGRQTLYDVLQVPCTASPGELRVAFRLRQLELEAKHCPRSEYLLLERAFNILGDPGLRACYDALLKDPEAPALFPYGGLGSLLVSGERSRVLIYLFRDEYIFALERAVVVETPQLGNATYLFTKPQRMDAFLAAYTRVSKDDIRRNRANIGEKLGFRGRIIHGSNPRSWAKELGERIGEPRTSLQQ